MSLAFVIGTPSTVINITWDQKEGRIDNGEGFGWGYRRLPTEKEKRESWLSPYDMIIDLDSGGQIIDRIPEQIIDQYIAQQQQQTVSPPKKA